MIPRIILEYPRIRGQAQALRGIQIHINRIKIGEDGGGREAVQWQEVYGENLTQIKLLGINTNKS